MGVGLYIHIPFCMSKCAYCDFVSFPNMRDAVPEYIDCVINESKKYRGATADTVFIGGGTPAFLDAGDMTHLMRGVCENIKIEKGAEFSVEVNPNAITREKAEEYASLGVNRVSVGLQSAQERLLKFMGRTHSLDDYFACMSILRNAGIHNLNTDIIYGIPTQSVSELADTIGVIDTPHVSAYSLKIEPGTRFYAEGVQSADDKTDREMYHTAVKLLESKGLHRYEISNFARPGFECAHNIKYWTLSPYIGLGVSAHSCMSERYANTSDISEYISSGGDCVVMKDECGDALEYVMLRLRLAKGFSIDEFRVVYGGENADKLLQAAKRLERMGVLSVGDNIALTDSGFDVQDHVVIELTRNI